MADLVMGASGSLIPKLYELLKNDKYNLQTNEKGRIEYLAQELEALHAALRKAAQVPWDQLDKDLKLWTREVREASYDIEDVVDTFLVSAEALDAAEQKSLLKPLKKMANLFEDARARRLISNDIRGNRTRLEELAERRGRYKLNDIVARPDTASTVDPRLAAKYTQVNKLVGMDKSIGELMSKLQLDDVSNMKTKTVSIVGTGGLGKTTLAKVVYDKLKGSFDCGAFVSAGRNSNIEKGLKDILVDLAKEKFLESNTMVLDLRQLIEELRCFLKNKRYFIVIDDIWDTIYWQIIRLAFNVHGNCGGRVIITTRILEVAETADEVYQLQPLPHDVSRKLLYTTIFADEGYQSDDDLSYKIVRKCGGIPLAIITMGNLLASRSRRKWSELYETIHFGEEYDVMMRILSFSYYDLPSHLRACLLYLSAFPEYYVIPKDSLIWMWVAEGFVQVKQGLRLFDIGEDYLNSLINRGMIQMVESEYDGSIDGCRVHPVLLDFICSVSREENFLSLYHNDGESTLAKSNVRRLAHHGMTVGQTHKSDHFDMPKVRSFIAFGCAFEGRAPLSKFKLIRVLAIENCRQCIRIHEHLGHLIHLRFLSLRGTPIDEIPVEIGRLKFLQTLDLWGSDFIDLSWSRHIVNKLVCLRITIYGNAASDELFPVERLTSLEELSIHATHWSGKTGMRWHVKELCRLSRLTKLDARILWDEETERDLVVSLCHLHELQHLRIQVVYLGHHLPRWQATELVLPGGLRHLAVTGVWFCELPSCLYPRHLLNLSHLDMSLEYVDEQDLKILGGFPWLRFLALSSIPLVTENTNDVVVIAAGAFPKLQYCYNMGPVVLTFLPGAMPSLEYFMFDVNVRRLKDCGLGFHHFDGLRYLPSLEKVHATIVLDDAKMEEAEEAEAALRAIVKSHKKLPNLSLNRVGTCEADKQILRDSLQNFQAVPSDVIPLELSKHSTNDFSDEQKHGISDIGIVHKGDHADPRQRLNTEAMTSQLDKTGNNILKSVTSFATQKNDDDNNAGGENEIKTFGGE